MRVEMTLFQRSVYSVPSPDQWGEVDDLMDGDKVR